MTEYETAQLGDVVYWYPGGTREENPHVGIVTGLGLKALNINVLSPRSYNFLIRDGVRHIGDRAANPHDFAENGAWEHTPRTLAVMQFERFLADRKEKK